MTNGDEQMCDEIRKALNQAGILEEELDVQFATKFSVKSGVNRASILVYNSGNIQVQGKDSELREWLVNLKSKLEFGNAVPGRLLPSEIKKLPQGLREKIPECDDVILWFFEEAFLCYEAGSTAGAAFMLGAASEKAILNLIEVYGNQIKDLNNRKKFFDKVNNRMISVRYEKFKQSYKSSNPKIKDCHLAQDLDQLLDGAFNFYRYTRNQVGHPQIIPDLDKGVILGNLCQFPVYLERIYKLIEFFEQNDIVV